MSTPTLSVRPLRPDDIEALAHYWLAADPAYLQGMGVDLSKMPTRTEWIAMLQEQLNTPLPEKKSYCLIWEVDGRAVGHSNINQIQAGQEAYMHLHIWDAAIRKQGYGEAFVLLTLPHFFEAYALQRIYCEPYALNPAPNKTLEKLGFQLVKEHITTPGWINFEQPVKRWELRYEQLQQLSRATSPSKLL